MKRIGDYWSNHGMWPIILVYFFPTKTMEMIKNHFNIRWENTAPGTEFARDFCAGIGPLQLGVVLVYFGAAFLFVAISMFKVHVWLKSRPATRNTPFPYKVDRSQLEYHVSSTDVSFNVFPDAVWVFILDGVTL